MEYTAQFYTRMSMRLFMTKNWNNVCILSTAHQPVRRLLCEVWWCNCENSHCVGVCVKEHFLPVNIF